MWLLLQRNWRSADPFPCEIDRYLDAVSNLDERNATVHAELLAVEGHCPFDRSSTFAVAGNRKRQPLLLRYSAYCEVAVEGNGIWAGLFNLVE
jgi:hypothetical protein